MSVSVIVVGAGRWGKNLIRNFYDLHALAGVVEPQAALRQAVTEQFGCPTYIHLDAALAQNCAVVIATPAPTHFDLARRALEADRDVFVEKPLTLKASEARELAQLAEARQRILMVGHLLLYQPAISWMRDYLASGKTGAVWHIATRRAKLGKARDAENVWWSFAPHDISVVLELLGHPRLDRIRTLGHCHVQPHIEDNVDVLLSFSSGQSAHIHSSWYWPYDERKTTLLCDKQMIVYDELAQRITIFDKGINPDLSNREGESWSVDVADAAPLKLECQHFLECIANRARPRSDGWNGTAVVDVLERVQRALKEE